MMLDDGFTTALKMGDYGAYVWSCYGLTLVALMYLAFTVRRTWQNELKQARRRAQAAMSREQA
ncbi:MAG: heme exporter protein CcmD [Steroidobacteraceae bacterium]